MLFVTATFMFIGTSWALCKVLRIALMTSYLMFNEEPSDSIDSFTVGFKYTSMNDRTLKCFPKLPVRPILMPTLYQFFRSDSPNYRFSTTY